MIDWYQTIPELGIKGRINTPEEFEKIGLPKDLTDKCVLDIGCNTGAYLLEAWKRGATSFYGIEPNLIWRLLCRGILEECIYGNRAGIFKSINEVNLSKPFDLVLLLSITHVAEGITGQELLDKAWELTGKLLILEINDRLQKEPLKLPKEAVFYGKAKNERSVYHCLKNNG